MQRTNNFNETLFYVIRKNYLETIDNFKFEFNLFKDAIVYRTKELVDIKSQGFKKVSEVLRKELGDTHMVIDQSLQLAINMRNNIWPDIKGNVFFSYCNLKKKKKKKKKKKNNSFSAVQCYAHYIN